MPCNISIFLLIHLNSLQKITSLIKSWIYADLLVKPEEIVLYQARIHGGLGLINVKCRAMSELIKTFVDTAINPKYRRNLYHLALYKWYVEDDRTIPNPGKNPYYSNEFFATIKRIKQDGLLRISGLSIRQWYKVLLEQEILNTTDSIGRQTKKLFKVEKDHPEVIWENVWSLVTLRGLESVDSSFLFRLLHSLLPTQERLFKILGCKVTSSCCPLCLDRVEGIHCLMPSYHVHSMMALENGSYQSYRNLSHS